jgi:hypothetical protein
MISKTAQIDSLRKGAQYWHGEVRKIMRKVAYWKAREVAEPRLMAV